MLGNINTFHSMVVHEFFFAFTGLVDCQGLVIYRQVCLLVDRLACSHTVLGCAPCLKAFA